MEEDGNGQLYYAYTDYLGSLTGLTDAGGNMAERQAFDPWGNRRNPNDWTSLITTPVSNITGRGYTMHEHLDDFALINMNGRVYDPQIARFLSPDPQLQAPGYWLNYNRYGYCLNNPLIYTDPDGEFWHLIIGAAIGGTFNWAANGAEFSWEGLGYFGIGAAAGAVGAGVGTGISSAMAAQGSFGAGFMLTKPTVKMATGFTAGAISGFGGGFAGGFLNEFSNSWLMEEQSFNSSISGGWDIGWKAGFSGAIVGGIMGGIDAAENDLNFLTGARNQEVKIDINELGVADIAHREAREDLVTIIDDNNPLIDVQPFENGSSFVTIKTPKGIRFFTKAETIYTNQSIAKPSIIKGGLQFTQFQDNTAIRLYGNRFFFSNYKQRI